MDVPADKIDEMAEKCVGNGTIGNFVKLDKKAVAEIYRRAL